MREALAGLDHQIDLLPVVLVVAGLGAVDERTHREAEIAVRNAELGGAPAVGLDPHFRVPQIEAGHWNRALLEDLSTVMEDASICGLGQAAPNPIRCVFEYFSEEIS